MLMNINQHVHKCLLILIFIYQGVNKYVEETRQDFIDSLRHNRCTWGQQKQTQTCTYM